MKRLAGSTLRKAPPLLALWLLFMISLPAGALPSAHAAQAPALPADFNKSAPANGSTGQPLTVTLEWTASIDATSYEYCYDTTPNGNCNGWLSADSATSISIGPLAENQLYSWHVRALNDTGTTYSDGLATAFWSFTTGGKPGTFTKNTPAANATAQPLNLNLTWSISANASTYEYCLDTLNNGSCDMAGGWFDVGSVTSYAVGPLTPATTYYWHIRANNAFGTTYSGASATAFRAFTTLGPPAAFGKTAPANGATGQPFSLNLTWAASTDAASYEYCIDATNNDACDPGWTSTGTALSASLTNLDPATTYYWQVRAVNAVDTTYADGSATAFWAFTTGTPPGAFGKSAPGDGSIGVLLTTSLTWGASAGAASYQYCIDTSDNGACDASWVSTGTARTASPTLDGGVTYYWQVRAINTFGTTYAGGAASAFWSFTTGAAPGAFGKTSPSNGAANQLPALDLVWGTSTNADTYEYCYDTTNDDACASWTSTTATSVSLTNLAPGTIYYWHVRAVNTYGTTYSNGFLVNDWSFTIGSAPAPFNKISPAAGATDQSINPTLQWTASSNFTRYEYCYDLSNNGACDDIWRNAGSLTSVAIGPLTENTLYSWQVRAVNIYGFTYANGSEAAFRAFTTGTLPGAFNKTSPLNNAINRPINLTLTWGTSTGAAEYFYCLDVSTALCDATWVSAGTQTSAPVSLDPSTTYYWHVRAVNNAGTTYSGGSASAFFSFTTGTPPGAFGKIAPVNLAQNVSLNPTLSWGTSTGAGSYAYCYDTINNNICDAGWINVGASTSDAIGPLLAGTTYYWHVRAINSFGYTYSDGADTAFWSFTTGFAPGDFDKSSPSNGAVNRSINPTLQWQPATGATRYRYCYDTIDNGACDATWLDASTSTSVSIGPLTAGTTYYWQVRAHNSFGITYAGPQPASFWSFTTGPAPGAFARSAPANGETGVSLSPDLTWASSADADHYEYCYSASATVTVATCSPWTGVGLDTTAPLAGLSEYTTYYWHVRAVNPFATTYADDSTAFWSFTTGGKPGPFSKTSPPNTLTVARPLNTSLAWGASSNAVGYEYCIATSKAACTNWTPVGNVLSKVPGGLSPSTIYYWHVRAVNEFGVRYANNSSTAFWSLITGAVCPSITGWTGQYWRNETLTGPAVLCRSDANINFYGWEYGPPGPKITSDHFSARWTRTVNFATGGLYRFRVDHDDGARLYIDGVLKGNWWTMCCRVDRTDVTLTAGNHTLRLDYREISGEAYVHLWWEQINAQFISIAAQDGFVLESLESSNVGGSINSSSSTFFLGDDAADRQYRSILSFDTSGLPDNAVITSATLKFKGAGVVGTNPFNTHGKILGDIRLGVFGTSVSLQSADFQAPSSREMVFTIPNTPVSGWYSGKSSALGLGSINRIGRTQIRLRFQLDDNDDRSSDYMKFYSGNYSTAASRPVLTIVYYLPP